MKAIYFKLKKSSLSSVDSNRGGGDKDGVLLCRTVCVVNAVTKKDEAAGRGVGKQKRPKLEGRQKEWRKAD